MQGCRAIEDTAWRTADRPLPRDLGVHRPPARGRGGRGLPGRRGVRVGVGGHAAPVGPGGPGLPGL